MLSYETAKKLKDAGFPQRSVQPEDCIEGDLDCEMCGSHFVYNPRLEELIEGCGNIFGGLIAFHEHESDDNGNITHWQAYTHGYSVIEIETTSSTPEEAVAQLILKLNLFTNPNKSI